MDFIHNGTFLPNTNFWRINWLATANGHSVTEGGSSGSPLLNNNRRIIGQLFGAGLYCANSDCSNPSADIANYGKFNISWTGSINPNTPNLDQRRRLNHWLDPTGTGQQIFDGICPITGPNNPYSLQQVKYSVLYIPSGTSVTWTHSNNVYIINGQGTNQVTIQICGGTTATLTVTLLGTVNHVLTKTLTVNNGTFTAMPAADGTGTIVTLNHPYASCFDWEISSALNSIVGNGTKTCISNNSLSFAALAYNNEIVQVRAKNGSCTTPWFSANVIKWVPTLNVATSNLTPGPLGNKGARGTFTAYLTSPCPVADARYHWNFDFDYTNINLNWDTYIPQISANVCPCGDHYLTIEVYDMNNYSVVSNSFIFYGTCVFPMLIYSAPAPIGGSLFKVYEDPLNSDPIIDEKDNLDIDSKAKNPNIDFKTKDTYSETTALSLNIGSWSAAYPNPTNTELIIDIIGVNNLENTTTTTKVLLYSHSTTKLVFSQDYPISTQQIKIDTSKLPNGVYYLNIIENGEKMKEQTIIVNH